MLIKCNFLQRKQKRKTSTLTEQSANKINKADGKWEHRSNLSATGKLAIYSSFDQKCTEKKILPVFVFISVKCSIYVKTFSFFLTTNAAACINITGRIAPLLLGVCCFALLSGLCPGSRLQL